MDVRDIKVLAILYILLDMSAIGEVGPILCPCVVIDLTFRDPSGPWLYTDISYMKLTIASLCNRSKHGTIRLTPLHSNDCMAKNIHNLVNMVSEWNRTSGFLRAHARKRTRR